MRILFTQWSLRNRGGTELFTIETTLALKARGHDVRVYTPDPGAGAERLRASGVPVHTTLASLDWVPEIIHGQHHPPTMTALARFPGLPAIYYCHGAMPWLEISPSHPRIVRYVVVAAAMRESVAVRSNVPLEKITCIGNFVDLRRFSRVRAAQAAPQRAVVVSNYAFAVEEIRALEDVCLAKAVVLEKFGQAFGNVERHLEHRLPDYDIAFAVGRTALEAMASGCAVIAVTPGLAGHLITPDNFDAYAATNFAPRLHSPAGAVERGWIGHQLDQYSADAAAAVTAKVRAEHHLDRSIDHLETVYHDVLSAYPSEPETDAADDLRAVFNYFDRVMVPEMDRLMHSPTDLHNALLTQNAAFASNAAQIESLRLKSAQLKSEIAELRKKEALATLRWRCAQSALTRGPIGRLFLSRIKRLIRLIETGTSGP